MDVNLIVFIIFVVSVVVYALLNPKKCPKCKAKLKVDRINDPWGLNITKKSVITLNRYGDVDTYYICPSCGKEYVRKRNTSKIEPV